MRFAWVIPVGLALAMPARADDVEPWQVGVTDDAKAQAQAALERGNALFVQNLYAEALVAYQEGIAIWDHPAIRFNVAKTLIALDRPDEAIAHLERAMRFGPKPLADVWAEAVNYKNLLAHQLATLTVHCTQGDVDVSLDATPIARCPSTKTTRVRPGHHTLLARRAGFLPFTRDLTLVGGETPSIDVQLVALRDATITRTRWAPWKPWTVTAAGAVVVGLGLAFELSARSRLDAYQNDVLAECGDRGCANGDISTSARSAQDQASLRDHVGVSLMIAGGATVATGIALLVLNRSYNEVQHQGVAIAPIASGNMLGMLVSGPL